ncbi:outer membrane protein [Bartonella sp. B23]
MATKYLITASILSLILVSEVQAVDVNVPEYPVPIVTVPAFSWAGLYFGGQIGGFSSKVNSSYLRDQSVGKWIPIRKELFPKLSGFVGGVYAGYNVDIDDGFIIGIDTDIMWSDKKSTKDIKSSRKDKTTVVSEELRITGSTEDLVEENEMMSDQIVHHTLKQKWFGAMRVRIGLSADRIMPYVAGGVAYTQLRNIYEITGDTTSRADDSTDLWHDEKKKMIGYTLGGGIDFAMIDNFIVRAEYRYSDYRKKKLAHERVKINYRTNDFRIGVAYKF